MKPIYSQSFECEWTCLTSDPPQCQRASAEQVAKYAIRDFYFVLGPNSNTFAQDLIDHIGLEFDLPPGAWGSGFPGESGFNQQW